MIFVPALIIIGLDISNWKHGMSFRSFLCNFKKLESVNTLRHLRQKRFFNEPGKETINIKNLCVYCTQIPFIPFLKRRWSSRTFQYDYLVTTSPPSRSVPSTAASLRLAYRLRVPPTRMVWRAVCTRPGNVFTAPCWCAITSDSNFTESGFRLRSELR